jgi:acetylornithine aminotransferase
LKKISQIKEVRGLGLMIGIEFDQSVKDIRSRLLFEKKIFTGASGANIIRLLPPLCLSKSDADSFLVSFNEIILSE